LSHGRNHRPQVRKPQVVLANGTSSTLRPGTPIAVLPVNGSGLRYLPIQHLGNQSPSVEEAETVCELISEILETETTWIDRNGSEHSVRLDDVLIIAPHNAQVFEHRK
jgi:hypothetical protein